MLVRGGGQGGRGWSFDWSTAGREGIEVFLRLKGMKRFNRRRVRPLVVGVEAEDGERKEKEGGNEESFLADACTEDLRLGEGAGGASPKTGHRTQRTVPRKGKPTLLSAAPPIRGRPERSDQTITCRLGRTAGIAALPPYDSSSALSPLYYTEAV
jgi:hypothetical protein